MRIHGERFGETFLGKKTAGFPVPGDMRGWPVLWTSPTSMEPPRAFARAKAECYLSEIYFGATWIRDGPAEGWLIETDGSYLFWSGGRREGFTLRQEPGITTV